VYYFRQAASTKHKQHETKRHNDYLAFVSEPTDISGADPLELDAVRLANRYFTKRQVRRNIRRLRREYLRH
jgi:hypothetical protein